MARISQIARFRIGLFALAAITALLASALPAGAHQSTGTPTKVTVTAGKPTEFGFKLSKKTVKVGTVTFKVTNGGILPHDFKICSKGGTANTCTGKKTPMVNAGASKTLTYTFKAKGSYEYMCTVPGHAAGGMKGILKVVA